MLEERGFEVRDDCGRDDHRADQLQQRRPRRPHHRRAVAVHGRGPPASAADPRRGDRARPADRARRPRRQGATGQLEPPAGDLQRSQVRRLRPVAARPDPGGDPRPDPRGREVRLPQGLQVLDLRDVLDPRGDPARDRQPRADDPDPGPHRPARAQDRPRPPRAGRASWDASRPTTRSPRPPRSRLAEVHQAREVARVVTSLDRPVGEEEEHHARRADAQRGAAAPTRRSRSRLRQDALRTALDRLPEPEREVVKLRYGIDLEEPTALRETGRRLACRRTRSASSSARRSPSWPRAASSKGSGRPPESSGLAPRDTRCSSSCAQHELQDPAVAEVAAAPWACRSGR